MILVAFVGSARAWRLVWREQLVWLSALLEQNSWRSAACLDGADAPPNRAMAPSDDARPGARRAAQAAARGEVRAAHDRQPEEGARTDAHAHEQMDAMAAKWGARRGNSSRPTKLQKLPGPKGVVYMSE